MRQVKRSGLDERLNSVPSFSYTIAFYIFQQQQRFFDAEIFDDGNWLDEKLQYAMDLEFFIRLLGRGYRFKHISQLLADFRMQPNSKTCSSPDLQRKEHQEVVFAAVPTFRRLKSLRSRRLLLGTLRSLAFVKRSWEKMVRGYYWEQVRSNGSSLIGS